MAQRVLQVPQIHLILSIWYGSLACPCDDSVSLESRVRLFTQLTASCRGGNGILYAMQ